jgi:hypothetical protein
LEPRGDIDPVAHQIAVALLHNIAEMNADAEFDALVRRDLSVALDHRPLDFNGAIHRVDAGTSNENQGATTMTVRQRCKRFKNIAMRTP